LDDAYKAVTAAVIKVKWHAVRGFVR